MNPLECGCAIVVKSGIDADGERRTREVIQFCPLHAHAEEMREALKELYESELTSLRMTSEEVKGGMMLKAKEALASANGNKKEDSHA